MPPGTKLAAIDLLQPPLIHLEGPYDEQTRWTKYFHALGIDMGKVRTGITVNSYTNLVQAALDGQGFALIGPPLIENFLNKGSLIQPVDAPPIIRHAFYLALPKGTVPASSQVFSDWVVGAFPGREVRIA